MSKSFGDYFRESMESMGLPVPNSLFADVTTAIATLRSLQGALAAVGGMGSTVTLAEVAGAASLSELAVIGAGITAAFYVGACIGAIIYAAGCTGIDAVTELMSSGIDPSDAAYANVSYEYMQQAGYAEYQSTGGSGEAYA